mmetsp:Transcript_26833/g.66825  ORF Transcript_26833/g.66825 Transcript_26833/m.66825 type:complete len:93 (+) Transcript_26833:1430-1708(+)
MAYPGPRTYRIGESEKRHTTQTDSVSDILTSEMRWTLVDGMTAGRQAARETHRHKPTDRQTDRRREKTQQQDKWMGGWVSAVGMCVYVYVCV